LEYVTRSKAFTALGRQLDTDKLIRELSNLPPAQFNDSQRLHIPRSLRLVYDVRGAHPLIAVGTSVTGRPPHRSRRAQFTHRAPTSGD
jgi:hypothetical protein